MKNRSVFSPFTLILVIFGLFAACSGSSGSGSSQFNSYYTVNFEANGGSPAPDSQTITSGGKVFQPPAMTKTGYGFGGWYKETACTNQWDFDTDTVTGDITLYAKWNPPIIVPGNTLYAKLQWLGTNVASNSIYIFEIAADESLGHQELVFPGKSNITIQLQGNGSNKTIKLSSNSFLFTIKEGVTLILDKNLILLGKDDNTGVYYLVEVSSGSTLIMNQGAKITGNSNGGVHVGMAGTFTMNGGEISGNTPVTSGGGVSVHGTFTMNGGEISNNSSTSGGGVMVWWTGTFTMNGGEISGNTSGSLGGGVYVDYRGAFTKSGGTITGYANDIVNGNVVKNSSGVVQSNCAHAVYVDAGKFKETTAGPGVNLSYNGKVNPSTWSGAWDY